MTVHSAQRKQAILDLLNGEAWQTSARLAAAVNSSWESSASAAGLLRRLAGEGLVTFRLVDPPGSGNQIREYALTDAGRAAVAAQDPARAGVST